MKIKYKIFGFILFFCWIMISWSCVDEGIPETSEKNNIPNEMIEGYTLTFQMALDPMGGLDFSRAGSETRDIEDFIDLERLRILFFTCDYEDYKDDNYYKEGEKEYHTGKHDVFLFESKSRWVSEVESSSSASRVWQITAPVFTYGNEDKYDWEKIREALTSKPFKIAILANRPRTMRFGDFDAAFDGGEFWFGNGGPYWGPEESFDENVTINDLHHCQWDPVYTSKNLINGISSQDRTSLPNGNSVYNFIMKNPVQQVDSGNGKSKNLMGAVSQWTKKGSDGNNYYFHPDRENQGIPMYGVQIFDPITEWSPGSSFNISESQKGQDNSYYGKTISLLRSLARVELLIPKTLGGKNVIVSDVILRGSNVMARCEPLDVATPTNIIWNGDQCLSTGPDACEWYKIQDKKSIVNSTDFDNTTVTKEFYENLSQSDKDNLKELKKKFVQKISWYYGTWKNWWDFNDPDLSWTPQIPEGPYPHIFNPCVQRNDKGYLDECLVPDNAYYHYVVYTGERNINDPTSFRDLRVSESKICFFQFSINYAETANVAAKTYQIAICDYSSNNELIKNYLGSGTSTIENKTGYISEMAKQTNVNNLNWSLLRNHVYRFTVNGINGDLDEGGLDGLVISTEERAAPDITYE